jgi:hypothetical protein
MIERLKEIPRTLGGKILCLLGEHSLTSYHEQGNKPTPEDLRPENVAESFAEYSALRCARKGCSWKFRGGL